MRKKTSRTRRPEEMSLEEWQIALRREFGAAQDFKLKNLGDDPIFSDFTVTNPQTGGVYRLAIRGEKAGDNYCSCPDFRVNTLGTCKHVEFTLDRLRRRRGAKAAFARGFHPAYSEIYLHYGPKREVVFAPGAECPENLRRLSSNYFNERGYLRPEAFAHFDAFLREADQNGLNGHQLRCHEDAISFAAQVRDQAHRRALIDKAFPKGPLSHGLARLLKIRLYPYQQEGALFAARAGRCLLADDMGLGKTIQAIAATEILVRTVGLDRVLIVCPTSLKHQWKDEIEKFTRRSVRVVEGLLAVRAAHYESESFFKITNYDVIHRDLDLIREWSPDLVILDEAQRIKNWKTRTAQSVKKLPSEHTIVLTGTPLENRLEELHSIVEFVDRFRLGPLFRFLADHQHVDDNGRVVGYRDLSGISKTLRPVLLRRTKRDVLQELPERLDKRFFVPMTPEQIKHHEENGETAARIAAKWRRYGFLSDADQRRLMIALQNMRMSCNSTYLLDHKTDFGVKADELSTLLEDVLEEPQTKVVIFSQWLRTHELLVNRFESRGWPHVLFHGGVPGPKRKDLVRRFREDRDCRLFLSTDAGGVGLNLQNASVVVNMDQPWNPAVLEQRIGRVHRLGQNRPVRVVDFVAQGTIEQGMLSLISFKKSMFSGVLDGGKDEVFLEGSRLKRFMETVEKVTTSIPESMPPQAPPSEEGPAADLAATATEAPGEPEAPAPSPGEQAWAEVASAGLSLLEKLGQALQTGNGKANGAREGSAPGSRAGGPFIGRDDESGQPYLKFPLPQPEMIEQVSNILTSLAKLGGNK